jgi:hypothetical protein
MCKGVHFTTIVDTKKMFESRVISPPLNSDFLWKPTRHIHFASSVEIIPALSPLDFIDTGEEFAAIWYAAEDLDRFRSEVRDMCRKLRTDSTEEKKACTLALDHLTRGLEQRTCLERQRRKYLSIKCIVRAQHKLEDSYQLACLAYKCTHWASELALEEAARDFVRAYVHETDVKRVRDEHVEDERRVRPCLRLDIPV